MFTCAEPITCNGAKVGDSRRLECKDGNRIVGTNLQAFDATCRVTSPFTAEFEERECERAFSEFFLEWPKNPVSAASEKCRNSMSLTFVHHYVKCHQGNRWLFARPCPAQNRSDPSVKNHAWHRRVGH